MGCDIHSYVERHDGNAWSRVVVDMGRKKWENDPFGWRSYGMFGFLADVRNYSAVPPISKRRGLPLDMSDDVRSEAERWAGDAHSASWLTVAELLAVDFDTSFEDRRVTRNGDGGFTGDHGEGRMTTLREFLGEGFFDDLDRLKDVGDPEKVRVVFWFDN